MHMQDKKKDHNKTPQLVAKKRKGEYNFEAKRGKKRIGRGVSKGA